MTVEREAMTLERQAFEIFANERGYSLRTIPGGRYGSLLVDSMWNGWQAAITYLSRSAEPVKNPNISALNLCQSNLGRMIEHPDDYGFDDIDVQSIRTAVEALEFWKQSKCAAEPVAKARVSECAGEVCWELYNHEPLENLPVGNYKLYLQPPEPAQDAKDKSLLTGTHPDGRSYGLHGTKESVEAVSDLIVTVEAAMQDAKDAARYRFLRDSQQELVDVYFANAKIPTGWNCWDAWEDKDACVDHYMKRNAAMTQESHPSGPSWPRRKR